MFATSRIVLVIWDMVDLLALVGRFPDWHLRRWMVWVRDLSVDTLAFRLWLGTGGEVNYLGPKSTGWKVSEWARIWGERCVVVLYMVASGECRCQGNISVDKDASRRRALFPSAAKLVRPEWDYWRSKGCER